MANHKPYVISACKKDEEKECCKYLTTNGKIFRCSKIIQTEGFTVFPFAQGDNCSMGTRALDRIEEMITLINKCEEILEMNSKKILESMAK